MPGIFVLASGWPGPGGLKFVEMLGFSCSSFWLARVSLRLGSGPWKDPSESLQNVREKSAKSPQKVREKFSKSPRKIRDKSTSSSEVGPAPQVTTESNRNRREAALLREAGLVLPRARAQPQGNPGQPEARTGKSQHLTNLSPPGPGQPEAKAGKSERLKNSSPKQENPCVSKGSSGIFGTQACLLTFGCFQV